MQATERPSPRLARDEERIGGMQATHHDLDIVLKPLSRPELGEIRIDGSMFAVGRTEKPFAAYEHGILEMLSRRHARIFCEEGAVYLADLESRNGTTVNRAAIAAQAPCRLRDGDEVCFGGVLSYRVEIAARAGTPRRTAEGFSLTLTPASTGNDLQPIVITRFPFLVSKNDAAFSRHQNEHGRQLSFLSRRHAHIFRKDGGACIEDLDSSNGTFVDGLRLQEHAVPLEDGMLLAFGGDHFTYRVSISQEPAIAPTNPGARAQVPQNKPAERKTADVAPVASDKTTFVVAPTSFLDIFCVDEAPNESVEPTGSPWPDLPAKEPVRRKTRGRSAVLLSELVAVFAGTEHDRTWRSWWKGAAVVAVLGGAALALYLWGAAERELKEAVARGEYAQAATLANQHLQQRPDDADLKALALEAALKANVPAWLT